MQPGLLGPYTTKGNEILDKNGNPHFFRGLDRPGLETSCTANIQYNEYSVMNSWGANVVRLPVAQDCWLNDPSNPSYDSSYETTVDDQVQAAMQNNMDIIIDLHGSDQGSYSVGQACLTANRNCEQILPDQHSVTFWQQVAAKYANSPNVIFELYNEPHPGQNPASPTSTDWASWLNGNTCSTSATNSQCGGAVSPSYPAVGMQALYNAVRASAANIVIIGGLNWSYDLSMAASYTIPNGTNIVYNTHPYSDKTSNPGPAAWQTAFGYLAATYPVIATEFGFNNQGQTTTPATPGATDCNSSFDSTFIQYANQQGPSPVPANMLSWTAWAFYFAGSDECGYPALIYDSNYDPNAPGLVVQNALTAGIP